MLGEAIIDTNTQINLSEGDGPKGTQSCFVKVSFANQSNPNTPLREIYSHHITLIGTTVVTVNGVAFDLVDGKSLAELWGMLLNAEEVKRVHPNDNAGIVLRALEDFLKSSISSVIAIRVLDETSRMIGRETPLERLERIRIRTIGSDTKWRKLNEMARASLRFKFFRFLPPIIQEAIRLGSKITPAVSQADIEDIIAQLSGSRGHINVDLIGEKPLTDRLAQLRDTQQSSPDHILYQGVKIISDAMLSPSSKCAGCPISCGRSSRLNINPQSGLNAAASLIQPAPSTLIRLSEELQGISE